MKIVHILFIKTFTASLLFVNELQRIPFIWMLHFILNLIPCLTYYFKDPMRVNYDLNCEKEKRESHNATLNNLWSNNCPVWPSRVSNTCSRMSSCLELGGSIILRCSRYLCISARIGNWSNIISFKYCLNCLHKINKKQMSIFT